MTRTDFLEELDRLNIINIDVSCPTPMYFLKVLMYICDPDQP